MFVLYADYYIVILSPYNSVTTTTQPVTSTMNYIQPNEFGFGTALALLESADPFPVDFDAAWQWLGYQRKDYAKETLVRNFERGLDYTSEFSGLNRKTPDGGRPSEFIYLTIDCFKAFGMMAGTEKGKQVRRYFLECERKLKQVKTPTRQPTAPAIAPSQTRYVTASGYTPRWRLLLTFLRDDRDKKYTVKQLVQELNMRERWIRRLLSVLYRQELVDREYSLDPTTGIPEYLYWGILMRRTRSR